MQKHLFVLFLSFLFFLKMVAQNVQITYATPANFFVCDTAAFSVTLSNNTAGSIGPLSATVALPAGVEYVAGSAVGASDAGGTPTAPVFSLPVLLANASQTFTLRARASCSLTNAINAGQQFSNVVSVSWPGGNASIVTAPYPIETPLLVIVGATNTSTFAQLGQQLIRTFTIRNTRLGALQYFTFEDQHPMKGFVVTTDLGSIQNNDTTLLTVVLSTADFQQTGDGDGLFELDEEKIKAEVKK